MDINNLINEAKKLIKKEKLKLETITGEYPIGKNFTCPLCNYFPASARIYDNKLVCFACKTERLIKNGDT